MYVVRTCIRCGANVYLGGTKKGGTKRHWYDKPGIHFALLCKSFGMHCVLYFDQEIELMQLHLMP